MMGGGAGVDHSKSCYDMGGGEGWGSGRKEGSERGIVGSVCECICVFSANRLCFLNSRVNSL